MVSLGLGRSPDHTLRIEVWHFWISYLAWKKSVISAVLIDEQNKLVTKPNSLRCDLTYPH